MFFLNLIKRIPRPYLTSLCTNLSLVRKICLIFLTCLMAIAPSTLLANSLRTPETYQQQALQQYQQGAFSQAIQNWEKAASGFANHGQTGEHLSVLGQMAQAWSKIGQHQKAKALLDEAIPLAKTHKDPLILAFLLGRLGNIQFALGLNTSAEDTLKEAVKLCGKDQGAGLKSTLLNDLGNIQAELGRPTDAVQSFAIATTLANQAQLPLLSATSTLNTAQILLQLGFHQEGKTLLDRVFPQLQKISPSHEQAFAWLNVGMALESLRFAKTAPLGSRFENRESPQSSSSRKIILVPSVKTPKISRQELPLSHAGNTPFLEKDLVRQAGEAFWAAQESASTTQDLLAQSYAWGYLGQLYESQGRHQEALTLTHRAIATAQQLHAPESLYQWHWQTGRLLNKLQQTSKAILAYRRAINTLQSIRQEFMVGSRSRQLSFRTTIGPLFFELADLLLQQAKATTQPEDNQELLRQAQDTIELFKAAELQDYFKDDCVTVARSRSTTIARKTNNTAIIYPIVLPNRLELLVSLPNKLHQAIIPIPARQLTKEAKAFRLALQNRYEDTYLSHAKTLYDWLITPIRDQLKAEHISTLIFVPDGALRTIPMAPLFDGKNFLISQFALGIIPGLDLTDARPINRGTMNVISAGLSESVQGFPPLPNVAKELKALKNLYDGKVLLNEEFKIENLQQGLEESPYTILHIASHGTVGEDVKKSFLLAYDDKITMDRLGEIVNGLQFRQVPLELLTLSACETAAGNDRAALGLAGVAIKAGARSALATLWPVDDLATAELIERFYAELKNPSLSKAAALQRAQITILSNPKFHHPTFWAPFLLINNWL